MERQESSRWRWRRSGRSMLKLVALCFAVAISLCCVCSWACGSSGCLRGSSTTVLLRSDCRRRTPAPFDNQEVSLGGGQWLARRLLAEGPGSHPPRCTAKCGDCRPCYPVHVAVPPGVPVTTEYYPEAWRCKCGSRLYMP